MSVEKRCLEALRPLAQARDNGEAEAVEVRLAKG
jgi:hypothetical protein